MFPPCKCNKLISIHINGILNSILDWLLFNIDPEEIN